MPFTSGFFKAHKGDRKYNGNQLSEIFDGILKDGIIPSQGQLFDVNTANNGMEITVGTGRAWFDHTWSKNDSVMTLTIDDSDSALSRYDTVVLEVNHEDDVRANSIRIIKGAFASDAEKPVLLNTDTIKQYPLAHIYVEAGATEIKASNIENMVGREPTVFATGILETASLNDLWSQWKGEWDEWFGNIKGQLSIDILVDIQYQIEELKKRVSNLEAKIKIETVTHTETITTTKTWTNPTNENLSVAVRLFGGGGEVFEKAIGTLYGGGGGGHMAYQVITLSPRESVNVTIGDAGTTSSGASTPPTNGGTTSFGTYLSANGGEAGKSSYGGSGGTGGGGAQSGKGGDGSYGGGGGGGGGNGTTSGSYPGGAGGKGGTYGGGGGGGGGSGAKSGSTQSSVRDPGSGGSGGSSSYGTGGVGGTGGRNTFESGDKLGYPGKNGSSGNSGANTNSISTVEFRGSGTAGSYGTAGVMYYSGTTVQDSLGLWGGTGGGGGGGGGGYGGVGGNGSNGGNITYTNSSSSYPSSRGGAGGGGGGYGGRGGDGGHCTSANLIDYEGGGGGGGYGGSGGSSSQSYNRPGGGGGYGPNNYGRGGGGSNGSAKSGVCIITYTTQDLVVG